MTDASRLGPWLPGRWRALLAEPRWRLVSGRGQGLLAVLVIIHGPAAAPPEASRRQDFGALADLLGDMEPPAAVSGARLSVYAVRESDRALLIPEVLQGGRGADPEVEPLLVLARDAADGALLDGLAQCALVPATGPALLRYCGSASPYARGRRHFEAAARTWIIRARDYHGLPRPRADAALRASARREAEVYRRARRVLLGQLDRDALQTLCASGAALDAGSYNYLVGTGAQRRWRAQALHAYPGILPTVLGREVEAIVDAGMPLTPWLARRLQVPVETVRFLGRVPPRRVTRWRLPGACPGIGTLASLAAMVARTPAEGRPVTPADWRSYVRQAAEVSALDRCLAALAPAAVELFRQGSLRRFWRLPDARRTAMLFGSTAGRPLATYGLSGIEDTVRTLVDHGARAGVRPDALGRALGRLSIADWLRMNTRWHEAATAFDDLGMPPEDALRGGCYAWPALAEPWQHRNRLVVPLANSDALHEEGRTLRHCVGAYVTACLFTSTHLFSVRDLSGVPLSTVELRLEADLAARGRRYRVRLVQHTAARNGGPGPDCEHAVAALLERVQRLPLATFEGIERLREQRLMRRAEFDTCRDEARAIYTVSRCLPEPLGSMLGLGGSRSATR
jgi:hypothetical protein